MKSVEYKKPWYHGSPYVLNSIREGSTISQNINLARVFSHKPTCVAIDDNGHIKHNGSIEGYLYVIAEVIGEGDVFMHPRTTMEKGLEWLTNRELKVRMIEKTTIKESERFTYDELKVLRELGYVK